MNQENQNNDRTHYSYTIGLKAYKLQDYLRAMFFFQKGYLQEYPSLIVQKLMTESLLKLKMYNKASEFTTIFINNLEQQKQQGDYNIDELLIQLQLINLEAQCNLGKKGINNEIQSLKKKIQHLPNFQQYEQQMQKFQIKKIQKKTVEERKKEGELIYKLMQESEDMDYMNQDSFPVYILPMSWFKKWKCYTYYYLVSGEHKDNIDFMKDEKEEKNNEENDENPGIINPLEIIDYPENYIKDPDSVKDYCNFNIKLGLQENKDFIILPRNVAKKLSDIYDGITIRRHISTINDDSDKKQIEIWLKRINITVLPLNVINDNQTNHNFTLFISRKETANDLKQKIQRSLLELTQTNKELITKYKCKLWKLDARSNYQDVIIQYQKAQQLLINAILLDSSLTLDEAEISDNDFIIVEFISNQQTGIIYTKEKMHLNTMENCCAYCGETKEIFLCQCKMVKYCGRDCQKKDRNNHKDLCLKVMNEINSTINIMRKYSVTEVRKTSQYSRKGLTGLQNLGNTCFMNSALQCLSNVKELTNYMLANEFIKDINGKNPLGTGGFLAAAYAELMKEIWNGTNSYVSAWDLKKIIGKFAPQFYGYSQQDSHELLSYLLDGIHEDLNKIQKKPIVETIESNGEHDEEDSYKSWVNYLKRNQSIIVDLMVGQYKSTIICPDCKKISITFDPFMSVSLPLPNYQILPFQFYFISRDSRELPLKINFNLPSTNNCEQLKMELIKYINKDPKNLQFQMIKDHKIIEEVKQETTIRFMKEFEGIIFVFEIWNKDFDDIVLPQQETEKLLQLDISIMKENYKYQGQLVGDTEQITYTRYFFLPAKTSYRDIHIKIYQMFRPFYKNYFDRIKQESDDQQQQTGSNYNNQGVSQAPFFLNINLDENLNLEFLREEYEALKRANHLPYKIILKANNEQPTEVKYNEESFLTTYNLDNNLTQIQLELVLADYAKSEYMRFNRCQDASFNNTSQQQVGKQFSIYDCIDLFIKEEILEKGNEWYCNQCKKHKLATKKMELYKLPQTLVLHLKRFKTNRVSSIGQYFYTSGGQKISTFINYPINSLDMTKYTVGVKNNEKQIYDLMAVSNHYGGLGGGHYTAYAKNPFYDKWFEFNDSSVSQSNEQQVISDAAYVLFYRRRINEKSEVDQQQQQQQHQ